MSKFTDCKGREWAVELTAATVRKVRKATECDLNKAAKAEAEGKKDLAQLVFFDPMLVIEVLWAIVEERATAQGVTTLESFEEGFDAATNEAAGIALFGAIVDFFRPPAIAREQKKSLPAVMAKMGTATAKAYEKLTSPDGPPSTQPSPNGSAPVGSEPALPASTLDR